MSCIWMSIINAINVIGHILDKVIATLRPLVDEGKGALELHGDNLLDIIRITEGG